ncbi:CsbD family protein [Streptomyces sp. NPDC096136]|uniref:CsbD family protein n=1 Tax=Streptomyces sp. NPDC096136 TaxID=3366076 RepID=UPI0037F60CEF
MDGVPVPAPKGAVVMGHDATMGKVRGKIKEAVGKLSGNERLQAEGRTDQAKAKVREAAEHVRERAAGIVDSLKHRDRHHGRHGHHHDHRE